MHSLDKEIWTFSKKQPITQNFKLKTKYLITCDGRYLKQAKNMNGPKIRAYWNIFFSNNEEARGEGLWKEIWNLKPFKLKTLIFKIKVRISKSFGEEWRNKNSKFQEFGHIDLCLKWREILSLLGWRPFIGGLKNSLSAIES